MRETLGRRARLRSSAFGFLELRVVTDVFAGISGSARDVSGLFSDAAWADLRVSGLF
jgi:hypothetical protein